MYRVSSFLRHFAWALMAGVALATLWVNLDAASYYDFIEWRLFDLPLPAMLSPFALSLTPLVIVSDGLMALFVFFIGKELWEALVLKRGALSGKRAVVPMAGMIGGMIGAAGVWLITAALIETAVEATPGIGWQVPLGTDVVLAYVFGRWVFGPAHPALHVLLLITIASDILGLLLTGLFDPASVIRLAWLALPLLATLAVWGIVGARPASGAPEVIRRRAMALWPYAIAGAISYFGVAASGLPAALGLLPILPAIPHAESSFGLFAEAEEFLGDPLNRLAHALVTPLFAVLFLFGLTRGGIDLMALAPTSFTVLAALWLGKPAGLMLGVILAKSILGAKGRNNVGVGLRDYLLIAGISGAAFTIPVLAIETALPGGGMSEAARLGLALSLWAGPLTFGLARALPPSPH